MDISVNAGYLKKKRNSESIRSAEECFRIGIEAGFKVFDYSPNVCCDNWEQLADDAANAAAKLGVWIEQSHAPYNFYAKRSPEFFYELLDRSVVAATRMGISQLVFHADEYHPDYNTPFDAKTGLQSAYDSIAPHVEKALKSGVKVALENVFEDHHGVGRDERSHFCGDIDELIAIIEKFGDKRVGCCWDFGHGKLGVGNENHCDAIKILGDKITCTHVHDNYYGKDLHLPPFMGDADWESLMCAMKQIGYSGNLTFEMVYGNLYEDGVLPFMKNLYATGEVLVKMFNGASDCGVLKNPMI